MSKHLIAWHKNCLKNMQDHLEDEKARLKRQEDKVYDLTFKCTRYEYQIREAERQRKEEFDSERFLVKRGGR